LKQAKRRVSNLSNSTPAEKQRWVDLLKPVDKQWMTEMDGLGLPATKLYNDIVQMTPKK